MRGPRQLRVVALTVVALAGVLAAAPAVWAAIPKLDVIVDEACVAGSWPEGTQVDFTLMTAGGSLKQEKSDTAGATELATVCFTVPMVVGDRIRVDQGPDTRMLNVLKIGVPVVNRAPDTVKVVAKPGKSVRIDVHRCVLGTPFSVELCPVKATQTHKTDKKGRFTFDTTSKVDLRGADLIDAIVKNSTGDRFHEQTVVPVFFVTPGTASIGGVFGHRAVVEFQLLDQPGGTQIASAALPSAAPFGQFTNGSTEVNVQPGNRVIGDFSPDARMTVPALITKVNAVADTVAGTCFPNQAYAMITNAPSGGPFTGTAGASGGIRRQLPLDLTSASAVSIQCVSITGDVVSETFEVP